jgi:hypothetical protein
MAVAQREATRMAAVRHISQWAGRMVAAQRVPARMVAARRMAVAAGIAAGQAATAIEPSTAVGKYHPGVEKASSVQIQSVISCVAEAVAAHPARKLVLFDGKIVARDGKFLAAPIRIAGEAVT